MIKRLTTTIAALSAILASAGEPATDVRAMPGAPAKEPAAAPNGAVKVAGIEEALARFSHSVPLQDTSDMGRFCVEAKVEGKVFWMMVDSGADGIILNKTIADAAGINLEANGTATGATGSSAWAMYTGVAKSFKVGPVEIQNKRLTVIDLSALGSISVNQAEYPRGGQLGSGFLHSVSAAVDYGKGRLLIPTAKMQDGIAGLYQQAGYAVIPMAMVNGRFYVLAMLGEQPVFFFCDTGANAMSLRLDYARSLGATISERKGKHTTLDGTAGSQLVTVIPKLTVGPVVAPNILFFLIDDKKPMLKIGEVPVVGLMGGNFLKPAKAVLDFGSCKMVLGSVKRKK